MRLVKRILVFIGLKLLEIGGVAVVAVGFYWVGRCADRALIGEFIPIEGPFYYVFYTGLGFFATLIIALIAFGLALIVLDNWKKAGKIVGDK